MQPQPAPDAVATGRHYGMPDVTLLAWYLDDDRDIALQAAARLLSPGETARAERFRFAHHRDRYIRGRGYLRQVLGGVLGVPGSDIPMIEGGRGKPALAQGDLHFNMSHSNATAVLILSRHGEVGIDIEMADRPVNIAALSETCFLPHEIATLNCVSGKARSSRFFAFWTAKEARMKLTGEGMSLEPKSIHLTIEGGMPVACLAPESPAVRFYYSAIAGQNTQCCYTVTEGHPCRA